MAQLQLHLLHSMRGEHEALCTRPGRRQDSQCRQSLTGCAVSCSWYGPACCLSSAKQAVLPRLKAASNTAPGLGGRTLVVVRA